MWSQAIPLVCMQHQHGPKEFSLDRLMVIFYSIVSEQVPPIAHLPAQVKFTRFCWCIIHISLLLQVSTLVSLQLLARCSKSEAFDVVKYKCLVNITLAQQLSRYASTNISQV